MNEVSTTVFLLHAMKACCTYTSVTVKKGYKNKMRESCHESAAFRIYANLLQHIFSQEHFNGNCSAHAINNYDTLQSN